MNARFLPFDWSRAGGTLTVGWALAAGGEEKASRLRDLGSQGGETSVATAYFHP